MEDRIQESNIEQVKGFGRKAASSAAMSGASKAVANTAAGKAVGTGVGSSMTSALPILAAIYAGYKTFNGINTVKKLEDKGGVTDEELRSSMDVYGGDALYNSKYVPKEVTKLQSATIPKEAVMLATNPVGLAADIGAQAGLWGTKKHHDQVLRDRMRTALREQGATTVIDGADHVILADGTLFNIGKDGGDTYTTFDPTAVIDDSGTGKLKGYNVDASNPLAQQSVGFLNPFAFLASGGDDKAASDLAGYLSNAAMSNANGDIEVARQNALAMYENTYKGIKEQLAQQSGGSPDQYDTRELAIGSLQAIHDMGRITTGELQAFINGVNQTYGLAPLSSSDTPIEQDPNNPDIYASMEDQIRTQGPAGGVDWNPTVNVLGEPRPATSSEPILAENAPATIPDMEGVLKTHTAEVPASQPTQQSFVDQFTQAQESARVEAEAAAEEARRRQLGMQMLQNSPSNQMRSNQGQGASYNTQETGVRSLLGGLL